MSYLTAKICIVTFLVVSIFCLNSSCKSDNSNGFIEPTIDGLINEGEYTRSKSIGDYKIYWSSDENLLYMALKVKTSGWVAIGFQPDPGDMKRDVDFILGYVANGETFIFDMFSEKALGPHLEDEGIGGSNSIEENDYTIIEFKRALNTNDPYDYTITKGNINILWAYSPDDNIYVKEQHGSHRGYAKITI